MLFWWQFAGEIRAVLQTEPRFDHPDRIGEHQSEEARFAGGQHALVEEKIFGLISIVVLLKLRLFEFVVTVWRGGAKESD